jgi:hypothetical protein
VTLLATSPLYDVSTLCAIDSSTSQARVARRCRGALGGRNDAGYGLWVDEESATLPNVSAAGAKG